MPQAPNAIDSVTIDGNEAAAYVAHKTNEVIAIYPITPASPMGELADLWSAQKRTNIWGSVPQIVEMQSEAGAAGAVHGSLQAGSVTTTFTASQGLLLMIPNMYKIAGELTSAVFHIAARSVAAQALSIFGDHSDVMAARSAGWGMLFANSVQEVMDFALIAQAATLESRVPLLHVFDGFRTSHEVQKIVRLTDEDIRAMIDDEAVRRHRARALSPDHPFIRGTAQNPDVFFQARETVNPYYLEAPAIVQDVMDRFADQVGRQYHLFDYVGAPDADRVIVLMGSGAETAEETVRYLNDHGEKVGLLKVRLYRPWSPEYFMWMLPPSAKSVAVLDRTKEPGATGEPLYQDVVTTISEAMAENHDVFERPPRIVGGRYGLSSKEFTPAMVRGVFDELASERPKNHFTVGIHDDVTHTSIDFDPDFDIESDDVARAVFWGLGSDGTVGANKNTIKIIGEKTGYYAQGYFVYDSRKSGARTISHLRFGRRPIRSTYLIKHAGFVGVHQFDFLEKYDTLALAEPGATFLLNSPFGPDDVWSELPGRVQRQIVDKKLRFFIVDAYGIAREAGLDRRISTIMQTCYFALSEVIPQKEAIAHIKTAIRKTYGKHGGEVVRMNDEAVDAALKHLHEVTIPSGHDISLPIDGAMAAVPDDAPTFVKNVTARILAGEGDLLPVSALPEDGTYPSGTTRFEKRNLALEIPAWDPDLCIQCGKCVMVCPHAAIRSKVVGDSALTGAPDNFLAAPAQWRELSDKLYTLQVAVEDCTGCSLCVEICPVVDKQNAEHKALDMVPQRPLRETGREHWNYFLSLPETPRISTLKYTKSKDVQLLEPLFEFSGACAGCGETPYLILMTRLFGDRTIVANATGCSSIFGGNLPTTPWSVNKQGRGPAWSNSLFEDNAEFGLGMRLAVDKQHTFARELLEHMRDEIGIDLATELLEADQSSESGVVAQRERVERLRDRVRRMDSPAARDLDGLADALVRKSVWIVGGDGWAYDIGYGGVDHVLASGRNVNLVVLDTEVYSNTGGQASKATGLGAVAKFAAGGKPTPKKDLGMMAMTYGYVYVAQVSMGADENQTIKAFEEAEAYDGPSLIIAYGPCIAHGIDLEDGIQQATLAERSGYWPLYRFDPRRTERGRRPLQLDSKPPSIPLSEFIYRENRYRVLRDTDETAADTFLHEAQRFVEKRWRTYEELAGIGRDVNRTSDRLPGAMGGTRPPNAGPAKRTPPDEAPQQALNTTDLPSAPSDGVDKSEPKRPSARGVKKPKLPPGLRS